MFQCRKELTKTFDSHRISFISLLTLVGIIKFNVLLKYGHRLQKACNMAPSKMLYNNILICYSSISMHGTHETWFIWTVKTMKLDFHIESPTCPEYWLKGFKVSYQWWSYWWGRYASIVQSVQGSRPIHRTSSRCPDDGACPGRRFQWHICRRAASRSGECLWKWEEKGLLSGLIMQI